MCIQNGPHAVDHLIRHSLNFHILVKQGPQNKENVENVLKSTKKNYLKIKFPLQKMQ